MCPLIESGSFSRAPYIGAGMVQSEIQLSLRNVIGFREKTLIFKKRFLSKNFTRYFTGWSGPPVVAKTRVFSCTFFG